MDKVEAWVILPDGRQKKESPFAHLFRIPKRNLQAAVERGDQVGAEDERGCTEIRRICGKS